MKLNDIIQIINAYGKDVPCILRRKESVESIYEGKQALINKLVAVDLIYDQEPYGITLSDNLIEVSLDAPKIG